MRWRVGECRGRGGEEGDGRKREKKEWSGEGGGRGGKRGGGGKRGMGLIKSHHYKSIPVKRLGLYLRFPVLGHTLATPPGPNSTTRFCT